MVRTAASSRSAFSSQPSFSRESNFKIDFKPSEDSLTLWSLTSHLPVMAQACRLPIRQHFIYPLFTPRAVQDGDEVRCLQAEVSPAEAPPEHTWWDSRAASDHSKKQRGTTLAARRRCGAQGHGTPRGRAPWGCPATAPLPGTVGSREAADRFVSLAGSGGSSDNDYSGGRYSQGSRGMGGCVPPLHSTRSLHPTGGVAETGTIAGIASGLAMALIGAVTSYISYQQKKFCFSIQRKCPPFPPSTSGAQSKHPPICPLNPAAVFQPGDKKGCQASSDPELAELPQPWVTEPPSPVRHCTGRNPPAAPAPGPAATPEAAHRPPHAPTDHHSLRPNQHQTG